MGNDGKLNTFVLIIALALMLGIPVIGALVAASSVLQWFVF
jgi:hypothetical protein